MKIVVIDGINGAGKSTIIAALIERINKQLPGFRVAKFADPGTTPAGKAIRALVKDPNLPMCPVAQLLLYAAARADLWSHLQTLRDDLDLVILDRWIHSTIVYQGQKVPFEKINELHALFDMSLKDIDRAIILDVPVQVAAARATKAKGQDFQLDRFEAQGLEFQERLRQGYRNMWALPNTDVIDVSDDDVSAHTEVILALLRVANILPRGNADVLS
jgi:dTMP kinase